MFILVSIIERDIQVSAFATFLEAQEQMISELKECLYPDVMSKEEAADRLLDEIIKIS